MLVSRISIAFERSFVIAHLHRSPSLIELRVTTPCDLISQQKCECSRVEIYVMRLLHDECDHAVISSPPFQPPNEDRRASEKEPDGSSIHHEKLSREANCLIATLRRKNEKLSRLLCISAPVASGNQDAIRLSSVSEIALRCRISELEAKLAAVRTDYSKSILELERAMHTRFSKYEEVNKSLRIKLEQGSVRCGTLTSEIEGIERELEVRDKRHKDELTKICSGLHDKYERELNRMRAAFTEMEQLCTSAQHAKNILEVKLASLQERAISLENAVSGLESSIVLKDRVIKDLSEQLREVKTSSASCDRIKELETEIREAKRDSDQLRYECERISKTLEEKEDMLSYVSSEIEGIKGSFEEKLVAQHDQLVAQYQEKIDYMKCQLTEAAETLIRMEKEHAHQRKENAHLQSRIECMQHESDNSKSKQSEKLSQLQSLIQTFRDAYVRCMHVILYRLIACSSDTFSESSWGPCGCIVSVSGSPVALCRG